MKKIYLILSLGLILTGVIAGCASEYEPVEAENRESSQVMLSIADTAPKSLDNSQNIQLQFSLDLLKELSKDKSNVFYSSFSINQALTMAYFGAGGATQEEIKKTLGYDGLSIADIAAYQKYLLETYAKTGDTTFYSVNSMWIDDEIDVKSAYTDTMINNFDAEVENIDLQGENAVKTLNSWIDRKSKGMITKLFERPFDPLARLVLMNAIYFKGDWTMPFDPEMTRDADFNGSNSKSIVDMMYTDAEILGYQHDEYTSICMPYGDDERFRMIAILPSGDINEFIQHQTASSLNDILTTFDTHDESLVLFPKFEMEEKIILNDTLKALGIQTAFSYNADFGEISASPLYIGEALHKAKIIVDEEGTEAAAVTALVMKTTSMPMDLFEFVADEPFLFFIMDTDNSTVLFTGAVYDLE